MNGRAECETTLFSLDLRRMSSRVYGRQTLMWT